MTEQHPLTPPPEIVAQIRRDALHKSDGQLDYELRMIHVAYRAGADMQLDACSKWFSKSSYGLEDHVSEKLRAAMRPKPKSLKEQALEALNQADKGLSESEWQQRSDIIRRALERLQELEG